MSSLQAFSESKAGGANGLIVGSYTAPANHAVHVFFDFTVEGTAGANGVTFEIYSCDSFSGGTSSTWACEKVNQSDPETLQGTALKYTVSPTPSGQKLIGSVTLPTKGSGSSRVFTIRGGKSIYVKQVCVTDPTATTIVLNTNE